MTCVYSDTVANLMQELYFQLLDKFGLLELLDQVPFDIQQRKNGFTPAQRCLSILAALAQQCQRLTDWTAAQRADPRLKHWLDERQAPHCGTLSRSLAATHAGTVEALREKILVPLSDQALLWLPSQAPHIFVDIDNKALPAEGKDYEGTATGRMADGGYSEGYRFHLMSIDNIWALEMDFTGANAHAIPSAMRMVRRLMRRLVERWRRRIVLRGDSNHGSVQFLRFLQRYRVGYLLKCYNPATARRLWREHPELPRQRLVRQGKVDLLVIDLGPTELTGMRRRQLRNGQERRKRCQVRVPRVVVYHEDPAQVPPGHKPECFALLTTLTQEEYDAGRLLSEAYLPRGGDVENLFCQLEQAFQITHLRCRSFHGNYTFLLLVLIAATLTQMVREQARLEQRPIPPGLHETIRAAAECGLRLRQNAGTGLAVAVHVTTTYTATFQTMLRISYQHRFRFVA